MKAIRISNLLFLLTLLSVYCQGKVITYNYPQGIPLSDDYRVWADNTPQSVIRVPIPASYTTFSMEGSVQVKIEAAQDVKWVEVHPLSAGIKPILKEGIITFTLTRPCQLSLEFNGRINNPLFIFANPPEQKPDRSDPNVIYFEAGKIHKPGVIAPRSGQHLFIEGGAWVEGAISARNVEHVKVSGFGILDGSHNLQMGSDEMANIFTKDNGYKSKGKYQRFVEFYDSKELTIEDIILHNSTTWQVVPINCEQVAIRNLKLVSDNPSDDGIDIVRSRSVHIENCFIRVKDDCIAIKAHLDYPDNCIVDNILAENCVIWNAAWGNGLEIGFELEAKEVKNITFRNIDVLHVESGAVFSIHNSDKATVKNVLYEDIRIEDASHKLFDLAIFRSKYCTDGSSDENYLKENILQGTWDNVLKVPAGEKEKHARYRGNIENIQFRNIQILAGRLPYSLCSGYDSNHQVKDITIENLRIYGKHVTSPEEMKLYTEYTEGVTIK